jgi:hypothetical protein
MTKINYRVDNSDYLPADGNPPSLPSVSWSWHPSWDLAGESRLERRFRHDRLKMTIIERRNHNYYEIISYKRVTLVSPGNPGHYEEYDLTSKEARYILENPDSWKMEQLL